MGSTDPDRVPPFRRMLIPMRSAMVYWNDWGLARSTCEPEHTSDHLAGERDIGQDILVVLPPMNWSRPGGVGRVSDDEVRQ